VNTVETIDAGTEDFELEVEARGRWAYARRRFAHNRFAMASVIILVLLCTAGFLAPKIAPYSYHELNINALSDSPNWSHPFGTDENGRDYFSRILYGLGTTAQVMLLVGFIGTLLGVFAGAIAGFYSGWLDNLVMRFTDAMLAVPAIALMLTASAYLQVHTPIGVSLLLALILWPPIARIVRAGALSLREKEYVEAARAVGASDLTIIFRHILPNLIGPIAVAATLLAGSAVLFESALTFLGFGGTDVFGHIVSTHAPSLGNVLNEAQQAGPNQWWGETFPGLAIVVVVCINVIGDGLRDALEPAPRRVVKAPARRKRHPVSDAIGRAAEAAWPVARKPLVATTRFATAAVDRIPVPHFRRARGGRRLLLEAIVVVALVAVGAGAIYKATVHHIRSAWSVAGLDFRDVSRSSVVQSEASVAIDPADPRVLLAGSNNGTGGEAGFENTLVYSSKDGGAHWSSSSGPDASAYACGQGDPAVTIDGRGHEYYALLLSPYCTEDSQSVLLVAWRKSSDDRWHLTRVARQSFVYGFDDKPAIAVDGRGRVYVVWRRLLSDRYATFVLSHSDNHGRTWTRPVVVDRAVRNPVLPSIAIGPHGEVFVAGIDARFGVWLARSRDGGRTFQLRQAATLPENPAATCTTDAGGLSLGRRTAASVPIRRSRRAPVAST
jgi:peptide/nickel transport system permease protein